MKNISLRFLLLSLFLLLVCLNNIWANSTSLEGKCVYSVSPTKKVVFSPANLQSRPAYNDWRFADSPYDYLAKGNNSVSSSTLNWIDLFGWGTGTNPGLTFRTDSDYHYNEWGDNLIEGYGDGYWRTLTAEEWHYLLFERENAASLIGYGHAWCDGLWILPDGGWVCSERLFFSTDAALVNESTYKYTKSTFSGGSRWKEMLEIGLLFLPAAGCCDDGLWSDKYLSKYMGCYWSSSSASETSASAICFNDTMLTILSDVPKSRKFSVRVAREYHSQSSGGELLWSGGFTPWINGSGTKEDPYLIETPAHLAYLAWEVNGGKSFYGTYFKQTANFDLDSLAWTPIGWANPFSGIYNGDNFSIKNFSLVKTSIYGHQLQYLGIFGYVNAAEISNLNVSTTLNLFFDRNTDIHHCGMLAGFAQSVTIANCHTSGMISIRSDGDVYCGGLIGKANVCLISNSTNNVTLEAKADRSSSEDASAVYIGGIVSYVASASSIINCHNIASIKSEFRISYGPSSYYNYAGGIVAYASNSSIEKCSNESSIVVDDYFYWSYNDYYSRTSNIRIAGIAAFMSGYSSVALCSNIGLVSDSIRFGGDTNHAYECNHKTSGILADGASTSISNSYNTGVVRAYRGSSAGVSSSSKSIRNCYNIGDVYGSSIGAITGTESSTAVTNSYYIEYLSSCADNRGVALSAAEMKSDTFPSLLAADTFAMDVHNINQGYPIFNQNPVCNVLITASLVDGRIAGSVAGAGTFYTHTSKRISASPNYGYHFVRWSDGNTENPRNITLLGDTTLAAEFAKNSYSLTTSVSHADRGITVGDTTALYLDQIAISATANYGYRFVRWSDGVTSPSRCVNLTKDTSLVATFDKATFTASVRAEKVDGRTAGQIHGTQGTYLYLDSPIFTASALYGYHFVEWSDGVITNPRQITITKDTTIYAQFDKNTYNARSAVNNSAYGTVQNEPTALYFGSVTYTAVASAHYHFVRWSDGNVSNPRNVTITSDTTLTAIFEKDRHSVLSASVNGSVSGTGQYDYGTTVTLTAIPNNHYHFDYWSDNGNTNATRQVVVERDTTYRAIFAVNRYTITSNSVNGTVSGAGTYDYGQMLTLEATPASHYHFVAWSDGNIENPRSLSLTSDITIDPIFSIDQHTVYAFAQNGSVVGTGSFDYGTIISLEARANAHYHFVEWEDDHSTNIIKQYTVVCDTTFMAMMEIDKHTITTLAQNGTVSGAGEYNYGQTITLSASADVHYHFVGWTDGVKTATRQIVVSSDATYEALFELDQHFVSISALNGIVTGSGYFDYGTYVTLVATPDEGFMFVKWSDGYTDNPYTLFLDNDIELEAIFAAVVDVHNVSQSAGIAYCVQRTLYVENLGCEYSVFNSSGQLVYRGKDSSIILPNSGLYIVRMSGNNNKVCAW